MSKQPSDKKLALMLYGAAAVILAILIIAFAYHVKNVRDPGRRNPDPIKSGP